MGASEPEVNGQVSSNGSYTKHINGWLLVSWLVVCSAACGDKGSPTGDGDSDVDTDADSGGNPSCTAPDGNYDGVKTLISIDGYDLFCSREGATTIGFVLGQHGGGWETTFTEQDCTIEVADVEHQDGGLCDGRLLEELHIALTVSADATELRGTWIEDYYEYDETPYPGKCFEYRHCSAEFDVIYSRR